MIFFVSTFLNKWLTSIFIFVTLPSLMLPFLPSFPYLSYLFIYPPPPPLPLIFCFLYLTLLLSFFPHSLSHSHTRPLYLSLSLSLTHFQVSIAPRPLKTLQSGNANAHLWEITWDTKEFWSNPLMGWTSSADPLSTLTVSTSVTMIKEMITMSYIMFVRIFYFNNILLVVFGVTLSVVCVCVWK